MKKLKTFALVVIGLFLLPITQPQAIQLLYKDNKGHFHFKCTDKTGGKTIVKYRAGGVFVDGPTGQDFYPLDSATSLRSEVSFKITEKYARIGCREHVRTGP
jgi:hypothetical protein